MSDAANIARHESPQSDIYRRAAKYVGVALVGGFLMNLVFNAAFKGANPQLARIAAIIPGLFFYSAVPAGIIALCGIKKHGRKHLLITA